MRRCPHFARIHQRSHMAGVQIDHANHSWRWEGETTAIRQRSPWRESTLSTRRYQLEHRDSPCSAQTVTLQKPWTDRIPALVPPHWRLARQKYLRCGPVSHSDHHSSTAVARLSTVSGFSSQHLHAFLHASHHHLHLLHRIEARETRACRSAHAEALHQRLGAVVARAHGDALLVEQGA